MSPRDYPSRAREEMSLLLLLPDSTTALNIIPVSRIYRHRFSYRFLPYGILLLSYVTIEGISPKLVLSSSMYDDNDPRNRTLHNNVGRASNLCLFGGVSDKTIARRLQNIHSSSVSSTFALAIAAP